MSKLGLGDYEEIDLLAPDTPAELRGWGSPTILVNGEDVAAARKGDAVGCRIYAEPGGVPGIESIAAAIERAKSRAR